jgi:hypothetical protein
MKLACRVDWSCIQFKFSHCVALLILDTFLIPVAENLIKEKVCWLSFAGGSPPVQSMAWNNYARAEMNMCVKRYGVCGCLEQRCASYSILRRKKVKGEIQLYFSCADPQCCLHWRAPQFLFQTNHLFTLTPTQPSGGGRPHYFCFATSCAGPLIILAPLLFIIVRVFISPKCEAPIKIIF